MRIGAMNLCSRVRCGAKLQYLLKKVTHPIQPVEPESQPQETREHE
jgi:hypothetical protein